MKMISQDLKDLALIIAPGPPLDLSKYLLSIGANPFRRDTMDKSFVIDEINDIMNTDDNIIYAKRYQPFSEAFVSTIQLALNIEPHEFEKLVNFYILNYIGEPFFMKLGGYSRAISYYEIIGSPGDVYDHWPENHRANLDFMLKNGATIAFWQKSGDKFKEQYPSQVLEYYESEADDKKHILSTKYNPPTIMYVEPREVVTFF